MTFDFCVICKFCTEGHPFFRGTSKISDPFRGQILGQIQTKEEFSSLLFTVTLTALPWDFYFFKLLYGRTSFFRGTSKISDPFRGQILGQIQTKVLRVFLLAIHSQLDSFALRFLFLQTPATSYRFFRKGYPSSPLPPSQLRWSPPQFRASIYNDKNFFFSVMVSKSENFMDLETRD